MTSPTKFLQPGQHIVFEGDSMTRREQGPALNTWPFLRLANWHVSYAEMVAEWLFCNLPELNLQFRNAAVGGSNILRMRDRYEDRVKPFAPAWIVFTIGGNDPNQGVELDTFRSELTAYIDQAKKDAGTRFLYIGHFKPFPGIDEDGIEKRKKNLPYYDAAAEIVRAAGDLAINFGERVGHKAEKLYEASYYHTVYSDGTHFNAIGNHLIAAQVLHALGAYQQL